MPWIHCVCFRLFNQTWARELREDTKGLYEDRVQTFGGVKWWGAIGQQQ